MIHFDYCRYSDPSVMTVTFREVMRGHYVGAPHARTVLATLDPASGRVREEDSLVDKLVFWRTAKSKGAAIDPSGEAERLNRNAALGQSGGGKPKPVDGK